MQRGREALPRNHHWDRRFMWMELQHGRFYPDAPERSSYDINDIAHALSLICRYAGHGRFFLSVAQHCVEVEQAVRPRSLRLRRWALLHDAAEAYVVDMPSPVKHLPQMKPYRDLEARVLASIAREFGLDMPEPPEVKRADRRVGRAEAELLGLLRSDWPNYDMAPLPHELKPLTPMEAEQQFLSAVRLLWRDP